MSVTAPKNGTTVSIALCTYNGECFLEEQLESFRLQSTLPDELVISDDASTDGTVALIETFQATAPFPVRIFRNSTNVGYVDNFERALSLCTGSIIFPSDQDDVWKVDKIETILSTFEQHPWAQMVVTNAKLVDSALVPIDGTLLESFGVDLSEIDSLRRRVLEILLFGQNFVSGNTIAVRADLSRKLKQYPIPIGSAHDHWMAVIAALTDEVIVVDYIGALYRQHDSQIFGVGLRRVSSRSSLPSAEKRFMLVAEKALSQAECFERLVQLLDRLADGKSETELSQIRRKKKCLRQKVADLQVQAAHYQFRSSLGNARTGRLPRVLREFMAGRYRHSSGIKSAVSDLIRQKSES